ncbi:hypothetical protein ANN_22760 [Periplaneta americana]|uniref:Uncharacterized protein n=1 Tax=Periplaneta americana TaxID=6978 RepID=A0ABQ8SKL5_PERAM|nr:hypothetical protein ANN_22760 [Periplaneta americana]
MKVVQAIIMHTSTPNYLLPRFQFLTTLRNRHQALLSIPHHRTSLYSSSYTVEIRRLWNSLPNDVRNCRTLSQFKIKLENFVLVNVFSKRPPRMKVDFTEFRVANLDKYCDEQETLAHVLGFCRKGELLRIDRHNKIRSMIVNEFRRAVKYEVYEEIECLSADCSTRRADIIIIGREKKLWTHSRSHSPF